jgi:hypothetical protein
VGVKGAHGAGDGFELVLEEEAEHLGDGAAAGAGDANAFDLLLGDGGVELAEKVVGGLDGAAGDAAVGGEDEGAGGEGAEAEVGVGGAKGFEDGAVRGGAERRQFETDGPDIET